MPKYQCINICIPETYFNSDAINGYTTDTAPIFFPNKVGGYMPGKGDFGPPAATDKADAAYEWQFNGVNEYQKMDASILDYQVERRLVPAPWMQCKSVSPIRSSHCLSDVNSRGLKNENGAPLALDAGQNLSDRSWLTIRNGKVISMDFAAYARAAGRVRTLPAFDTVELSAGENQLFGTAETDKQHFIAFSQQHNTSKTVDYALPWDVLHSDDYDLDQLFT